jgi:predicted transcriptional regulator
MDEMRSIRVLKRITQYELRIATGIPQSKISLIENGLVKPRDDEKKRIAKALRVRSDEIWGIDERERLG